MWFRSPVWTRRCLARWPEVVNGREQVGQTCFFLTFSCSIMSLAVWMGGGAMVDGWVG